MSSPKRILYSANDPGGANAIAPIVEALLKRGDQCEGLLTGPACDSFSRRSISFTDATAMSDEALQAAFGKFAPDILLAGRSVGIQVDKRLLHIARGRNIPSVYVLDFWNDYASRFSASDKDMGYLPTIICVMDELAKREAIEDGVPAERIRVTGNPHLDRMTEGISRDREDPHSVLFTSQPIRDVDGAKYGFDEYAALEQIIRVLPVGLRLAIRLHPKDDRHKYDHYLVDRVAIADSLTLEEALSRSGLIIGMFSPVLIQAAAAGKAVISYEPHLEGADPLPTNRLGLTHCAYNEESLSALLHLYEKGKLEASRLDIHSIWPPGALDRILAVMDTMLVG